MKMQTFTIDTDLWQVVPKRATDSMIRAVETFIDRYPHIKRNRGKYDVFPDFDAMYDAALQVAPAHEPDAEKPTIPTARLKFDKQRFDAGELPVLRNGKLVKGVIVDDLNPHAVRLIGFVQMHAGEPFEMLTWKIDTGTSLLGSGFDLVYPNVKNNDQNADGMVS